MPTGICQCDRLKMFRHNRKSVNLQNSTKSVTEKITVQVCVEGCASVAEPPNVKI